MKEFTLSYIKGLVGTKLYNQIVDITGNAEDIDYESIDHVIQYSMDLISDIVWNSAVNFVKEDMKKILKENKKDEISNV